jgi:hypothetical protein
MTMTQMNIDIQFLQQSAGFQWFLPNDITHNITVYLLLIAQQLLRQKY